MGAGAALGEGALSGLQLLLGLGEIGLRALQRPGGRRCLGGLAHRRLARVGCLLRRRGRVRGLGFGDRFQDLHVPGGARRGRHLPGSGGTKPDRRSPVAAGRAVRCGRGQRQLLAGRVRLEELGMVDGGGENIVAHDDHAQADIRQREELLGERVWQAYAPVRRRLARQHARVQGDAGPGDALHEGHVAVFIDVGGVHLLLLHHAVDAGGGLVAGRAARHRRLQDLALGVVDGDALIVERHDRQQGCALTPALARLVAPRSGAGRVGAVQRAEQGEGCDGRSSDAPMQGAAGFHAREPRDVKAGCDHLFPTRVGHKHGAFSAPLANCWLQDVTSLLQP